MNESDQTAGQPAAAKPAAAPRRAENPLYNFLLNVLLPVLALSVLSKEGDKPWHIGPVWGMVLAVSLPLGYGIWHLAKSRQVNAFSVIGLGSVLLTGGITLLAWRPDGTIHPQAALMFALKEASIPFILGMCVLLSHRTKTPLVRMFLMNPDLFDVPRIEKAVAAREAQPEFDKVLWLAALGFAGSFLISTGLNFWLSMHFLGGVDTAATNAREMYNEKVGQQTFWGFFVIGVPVFIMLFVLIGWLVRRLEKLTGLDRDALLVAR